MRFRFIGTYTNGHTGVSILGHDFVGREATEVSDEAAERLARHPEFEVVHEVSWSVIHDPNDFSPSAPVTVIPAPVATQKRRGRPRKVS